MTDLDYITWINDTGTLVTAQLPLQSLTNAVNLAAAYVSNVGGWVPDNPSDPTGPGKPFNGDTPQQAANAITATQIGDVYDLNMSVYVTIECQTTAQLGSGLTLSQAAAALNSQITNFITNSINQSPVPMRVDAIGLQTPNSGKSLLGGYTTQAIRQTIAADLAGSSKIIDYKEIALQYATNINGLNDTWNVEYVYTQSSSSIVVVIAKYTDNTYATLDPGGLSLYIYNLSPTTYQIVTGCTLSLL